MREDIPTPLDRPQWLDLSSWLPASALLIVAVGCLLAVHTTVRKEREVTGVVKGAIWRLNGDTGERYSEIQVALDNKRIVRANGQSASLPEVGARVTLRKRAMLIGHTTYRWDGPARAPVQPLMGANVVPISAP